MNMRDYPTLHIDTNLSKGTVYSKKGYGCKGTVYSKKGYGCK